MKRQMTSQDTRTLFTRRTIVMGGIKGALTALLIGRLGYLGLIRSRHYQTLANGNRIKLQIILPQRGLIVDRKGYELAYNRTNYCLTLTPEQINNLDETLKKIDQLISLAPKSVKTLECEIRKAPKIKPFILKNNLTWEEVCKIQVNRPELDGISVEMGYTRHYPLAFECAHLIGFVQAPSDQDEVPDELSNLPDYRMGRTGLEQQYERWLQGKEGYREIEVNAYRRVVRHLRKIESTPGSILRLSLNAELQKIAFQRLSEEKSGAAVVMDIKSGEVLSCLSTPSFDSNLFVNGISHEAWNALNGSLYTPLNNKAIQGGYPPGSIFKMVVALAALETGKISPVHQSFCKGFVDVGSHRFHCVHRTGHGYVDMIRALQVSCDVYFYELAPLIGIDCIADMAFRLGLGEKTGLEMPHEKKGLVATRAWKKMKWNQSWTIGDTINASIGQGAMLSTPLQMAMLIARLLTGKAVIPTLLYQNTKTSMHFRNLSFDPLNLEVLKKGMDGCVNDPGGTAYLSRIDEPLYKMGGKTATSQVRRISKFERETRVLKNEEIEWQRRDHSIFAGYAPIHDPRYAVCVLVEHGGGGGRIATPIARDILWTVQREQNV